MRDEVKNKSELIKELQILRRKVSSQEKALNRYKSGAKKIKELGDTEERYRLISENSGDVIWLLDLETEKFSYVSPSVEKLRGFTPEEIMKQTIKDALTDESFNFVLSVLPSRISAFENGDDSARVLINEVDQLHKNGSIIHTEVVTTLLMNKKNRVHQILGVTRDITGRKKVETELQKSEERFRKLFEEDLAANFISTVNGKIIMCNSAFVKMFKYNSVEEALEINSSNLYPAPVNRDEFLQLLKSKGRIVNNEITLRRRDGELINVIENVIGHFDDNGELYEISGYMYDQTERKRVEASLKESEEKYRNIFYLAPVGIYQSTVEGRLIGVNERLVQILGYDSKEELMKCDLETDIYFNKEDRSKSILNYEAGGSVADLDLCWKKKDGTPIWIQLTVQATKDSTGNILYFEGFVRDVSERIEAETKLRENQKLLSTVIETMPVGIWLIDGTGKIMHGNSAAQLIWGGIKYVGPSDYGEYVGWFVNNGKKIEAHEWGAARVLKTGEVIINEEIEIECFNKEHKFIYHSAVPIRGSNKEIAGVVVVNQDITEKKSKELQIRMLSSAVEQSTVSVLITDLKGKIEYVNKKFLESTGYTREEVLGKDPSILKSGFTPNNEYKNMWDTITAGNEWRGELLNKTKDGSLFWEFEIISPIRNNAGTVTNYLAVKEDISNQKRMTKELIAAKEHAEHSDNLKTEFIAQMSHEIRTPLNILLSFSNFIKEELSDKKQLTNDLEEYFFKVDNAGTRIIRTIELILNMSELQSGSYSNDPKPTDIPNEILTPIYHRFHQLVDEEKLQFELIRNAAPLPSDVDHYSVEQIFNHLIENAIKFTEKGFVKIYVDKNEIGKAVVKIEDTGIGIGENYLEHLYSPFSQEDRGYARSFEGNGLGLALVKKYCDLNNIQISVLSKKREGSAFTLIFP
ncbi:MAG: sensor histidine kinase [Melioribacteraceae bacterium]